MGKRWGFLNWEWWDNQKNHLDDLVSEDQEAGTEGSRNKKENSILQSQLKVSVIKMINMLE